VVRSDVLNDLSVLGGGGNVNDPNVLHLHPQPPTQVHIDPFVTAARWQLKIKYCTIIPIAIRQNAVDSVVRLEHGFRAVDNRSQHAFTNTSANLPEDVEFVFYDEDSEHSGAVTSGRSSQIGIIIVNSAPLPKVPVSAIVPP
jgi:hypothetical protein